MAPMAIMVLKTLRAVMAAVAYMVVMAFIAPQAVMGVMALMAVVAHMAVQAVVAVQVLMGVMALMTHLATICGRHGPRDPGGAVSWPRDPHGHHVMVAMVIMAHEALLGILAVTAALADATAMVLVALALPCLVAVWLSWPA